MTHDKAKGTAIDIGCGTDPVGGCDAYVDLFPDTTTSRAAGAVNRGLPRFTQASLESLPFKTDEFAYSYARHVLEHVDDPARACEELMRVSKGGYIETPSHFNELLFGKKYHKWAVFWDNREKVLRFYRKTAEQEKPFGDFFVSILNGSDAGRKLYHDHFGLFINGFEWQGQFKYEIIDQ